MKMSLLRPPGWICYILFLSLSLDSVVFCVYEYQCCFLQESWHWKTILCNFSSILTHAPSTRGENYFTFHVMPKKKNQEPRLGFTRLQRPLESKVPLFRNLFFPFLGWSKLRPVPFLIHSKVYPKQSVTFRSFETFPIFWKIEKLVSKKVSDLVSENIWYRKRN